MKRLSLNLDMARAFHDGRKTRTWRLMKKQPLWEEEPGFEDGAWCGRYREAHYDDFSVEVDIITQPYLPGEVVFIAEPWHCDDPSAAQDAMSPGIGLYYEATEICPALFNWRSPAIMPEWASRAKVRILSCVPRTYLDYISVIHRHLVKGSYPPHYVPEYQKPIPLDEETMNKWGWAVEWENYKGGSK